MLTINNLSLSQLCCILAEKNHRKVTYLKWKANRKEHRKKLSTNHHLIMSMFSLFHFVAFMTFLALIRE